MRKLLIFALIIFPFYVFPQDFEFGKFTNEERVFERTQIDSNANAAYLNEYGTTSFLFDSETGRMKLVHRYHARIKIFDKEGFSAANVVVPLYKNGNAYDQQERIFDIKASTFNAGTGQYEETPMTSKAIFEEEKSKYLSLCKFTLPNVRENAIIEYQYSIETPYLFNFKTWEFQAKIPKVNSVYEAYIPANYSYNITLRGFYKLTDNKATLSTGCLRVAGRDMDCSKMTYVMKDVPAFVEEDYMTSPNNFKSAIYFELSEVYYLNGAVQKYTKSWKDVDYELISNRDFGGQMKKKDVFKHIIPTVTAGMSDELEKGKAIFDYIRKQVRWNKVYGKYSETSVKDVIDSRSGNVADINLALVAALSAADLDAEAVIISTRDNGIVNKLHPIMSDFNYVIAKLNIGNESYLLDATEPLTPFGLLPLRCINDQGRVMNLKKPSYWIDLKASQRSTTIHSMVGKMTEDGKITGTITTRTVGFDALNVRNEMKRYSSVEEYVEKLDERMTNIRIKNFKVTNVDSVEKPLIEEYEVEFTVQNAGEGSTYFNPFFINRIRKNPFKLNERNYPVDMGAANDERITISITLPDKYYLKEQPKDFSLALPNQGGRYLLQTTVLGNHFTISQQLSFNKAIYSAEEYYALKEFYNRIIQVQKGEVLLAKAN
jgi:Fe-S cluster assembly iron-binding protein IscA